MTFFFGSQLLLEAVRACFWGDDESIDNGPICVGVEGVAGDGAAVIDLTNEDSSSDDEEL